MGFDKCGVSARHDQCREPTEGRKPCSLAQGDLLDVKLFRVAVEQGLHDGMLGLIGLNERGARLVPAAGSPRHLLEQLEGALRGARIAASEPEIRIDDADQRQMWKVMSLCDELRPDNKIEGPFRDLIELATQPFGPAEKI